jgi:hypothetical protein
MLTMVVAVVNISNKYSEIANDSRWRIRATQHNYTQHKGFISDTQHKQ